MHNVCGVVECSGYSDDPLPKGFRLQLKGFMLALHKVVSFERSKLFRHVQVEWVGRGGGGGGGGGGSDIPEPILCNPDMHSVFRN